MKKSMFILLAALLAAQIFAQEELIDQAQKNKALYQKARSAFNLRQYSETVNLILSKEEQCDESRYLLALSYYKIRDYKNAVIYFEKLLETSDSFPASYYYLSRAQLKEGNLEKSQYYLDFALSFYPNSDFCYVIQGILFSKQQQYQEATKAFKKALSINASNDWAYNNYGLHLLRAGYNKSAKQAFLNAIQYTDDNPYYYNNLGIAWERLHNKKEAASAYQKAIELKPNYPIAKANLKRITK